MDFIDFIDAPVVRDHLRRLPPLPPAQQCILIAQSDIKPLTDKLAALNAIRAATPPEDFSRGCWTFQCDDPFPVILDRYLRTRAERLVTFRKAEPGVIYVVEDANGWCGAPFSTFDAAIASIKDTYEHYDMPAIIRRPIDDPGDEILDAALSRTKDIVEIISKRYHDAESGREWGGDLPNGYAQVPNPFKRGDIVRQFGDTYCVLADNADDADSRIPQGADWSSMRLQGVVWDKHAGTFAHDHNILFTKYGTEIVAPADLPENQRMLAAVSLVMRGKYSLAEFLELLTNGLGKTLEDEAMKLAEQDACGA